MDHAVALVQAYLRVNGFFTVSEYPILHRNADGSFREATDMDLLAVRLSDAGRVLPRKGRMEGEKLDLDPKLGIQHQRREFIIAEVKEGEASANKVFLERGVLYESMRRFGCSGRQELQAAVDALQQHGEALLGDGSRIRLIVFGSRPGRHLGPCTFVSLGDVVRFLRRYLVSYWQVRGTTRFRDDAMAFLALLEKLDGSAFT